MSEKKHDPCLPWERGGREGDIERARRVVYRPDGVAVAHCENFHFLTLEQSEANAALIVTAVNQHEQIQAENTRLREALTALTSRYAELINSGDCGNWDPEEEDEMKQARAALEAGKREGQPATNACPECEGRGYNYQMSGSPCIEATPCRACNGSGVKA